MKNVSFYSVWIFQYNYESAKKLCLGHPKADEIRFKTEYHHQIVVVSLPRRNWAHLEIKTRKLYDSSTNNSSHLNFQMNPIGVGR